MVGEGLGGGGGDLLHAFFPLAVIVNVGLLDVVLGGALGLGAVGPGLVNRPAATFQSSSRKADCDFELATIFWREPLANVHSCNVEGCALMLDNLNLFLVESFISSLLLGFLTAYACAWEA